MLLAAFPEVQDWIGEELRSFLTDDANETWDYENLFPRLKRCQAVLVCISTLKSHVETSTKLSSSLKLSDFILLSWLYLKQLMAMLKCWRSMGKLLQSLHELT
jgi:hypothetical protein